MSLVITQKIWLPPIVQELVDQVYAVPEISVNKHLMAKDVMWTRADQTAIIVTLQLFDLVYISIQVWDLSSVNPQGRVTVQSGVLTSRVGCNLTYNGVWEGDPLWYDDVGYMIGKYFKEIPSEIAKIKLNAELKIKELESIK